MLKRQPAGIPLRELPQGSRFVLLRTGETYRLLARFHRANRWRYLVERENGKAAFSDLSHQCRVRPINDDTNMTFALKTNAIATAADLLVQQCHGAAAEAGWWGKRDDTATNPSLAGLPEDVQLVRLDSTRYSKALVAQKLCLIHSEISEAMEGHRKGQMDDKLPHRTMIEVELADAMIRIADLAGALGLDLGAAVAEKMEFNAHRPDHKPEARAAAGGKAY